MWWPVPRIVWGEQIRGDESGMGKSAVLARLVSVCAVTALAGGALAVAPANAVTPAAPALSVATPPDTSVVRGDVVTTRGEARVTGLRITIAGVSGGRGTVRVTGPNQRSRAARAVKRYSKVIHRSTTLRVVPGVYQVTSRSVAATGGTDVPKVTTKTLRVRKNRLTGFTVRYRFVPVSCAAGGGAANTCVVGNTGPGGGKVFYVNEANPTGSRYMEAVVAGMTPAWDDTNASAFYTNASVSYIWCVGTGQASNVTTNTAIGTGKVNTDNMVAACTSGAANSVRAYIGGGLAAGSWSLPSKDELNELYKQRWAVGSPHLVGLYWASSQDSVDAAWSQDFGNGDPSHVSKAFPRSVRPVRDF